MALLPTAALLAPLTHTSSTLSVQSICVVSLSRQFYTATDGTASTDHQIRFEIAYTAKWVTAGCLFFFFGKDVPGGYISADAAICAPIFGQIGLASQTGSAEQWAKGEGKKMVTDNGFGESERPVLTNNQRGTTRIQVVRRPASVRAVANGLTLNTHKSLY